jgi:hypothetical protein
VIALPVARPAGCMRLFGRASSATSYLSQHLLAQRQLRYRRAWREPPCPANPHYPTYPPSKATT